MMAKLYELTNQIIRKRLTIPIYTHTNERNLFMNCETDAFMTVALIETYDKMILLLGFVPDYRIVQ